MWGEMSNHGIAQEEMMNMVVMKGRERNERREGGVIRRGYDAGHGYLDCRP